MLTQTEIEEFKQITLNVYGIKLSDTEARDQGERLLRVIELMAQTLKPDELVHKKDVDKVKEKE